MAVYLKIDGCEGESQKEKYEKQIDIDSWNWGLQNASTFDVGGGSGSGNADFQELQLSHRHDKASPKLMQLAAKGKHFPEAVLSCSKTVNGVEETYYEVKLKKVFLTHVSLSGSGGDGAASQESFGLTAEEVKTKYTPHDADGKAGADVEFGWNILKNVEV